MFTTTQSLNRAGNSQLTRNELPGPSCQCDHCRTVHGPTANNGQGDLLIPPGILPQGGGQSPSGQSQVRKSEPMVFNKDQDLLIPPSLLSH